MLCHRMRQFREYNELTAESVAKTAGVSLETYSDFENGSSEPGIEIIERLALLYKVTVNEFYGFTPRLHLHDAESEKAMQDAVNEETLKMSALSWDEKELIMNYRGLVDKESAFKVMINRIDEERMAMSGETEKK